jgi:glucosamine kinase
MADLVVGADVGGTSTRVAVADLAGTVVSMAVGGPGNPNTVGLAESAAEIRAVMDRALAPVSGQVVAVVLGLAGGSRAAAVPDFARAAVSEGVSAPTSLVGDLAVAFSSATASREGYVIIAGTGAVAGQVVDGEVVQQRDGWGWLLGDEGSGFWLGRAAVRATLDGLQQDLPLGPLQRSVLESSGAGDYLGLLQACYAAPPTWLARFSVLVSRHAAADPVAGEIAETAVTRLEELLFSLRPVPEVPVVLAGSVLATPGPVSTGFRSRLARRMDNPVLASTSGVIGALWLGLEPHVQAAPAVHARLRATAGQYSTDSR